MLNPSRIVYLGSTVLEQGGVYRKIVGPLEISSGNTTQAGLNLTPDGVPSAPVDGDIWVTSAGLFVQINGVTVGPLAGSSATVRTQRSVTASPIVIAAGDEILNVNINAGSPTCALPAASTRAGDPLTFKDVGGHFNAHNLTITPNGAETIDGLATYVLGTDYQAITLNPFNDGTNTGWFTT